MTGTLARRISLTHNNAHARRPKASFATRPARACDRKYRRFCHSVGSREGRCIELLPTQRSVSAKMTAESSQSIKKVPWKRQRPWAQEYRNCERGAQEANMIAIRSSYGVPGHRPAFAHREQPHALALPHAHLCAQHCCRQVPLLVLHARSEEGQEGHW